MTYIKLSLSAVVFALSLSACDSGEAAMREDKEVTRSTGLRVEARTRTRTATAVEDPVPAMVPAADSPEGKVLFAAVLAREISAAPEQADKILRRHGLDREELDTLMFTIAGDPELTRAYMVARRRR